MGRGKSRDLSARHGRGSASSTNRRGTLTKDRLRPAKRPAVAVQKALVRIRRMRSCCSRAVRSCRARCLRWACRVGSGHRRVAVCRSRQEITVNCSVIRQICTRPPTDQHLRRNTVLRTAALVPCTCTHHHHHHHHHHQQQQQQHIYLVRACNYSSADNQYEQKFKRALVDESHTI